ncbi:MAG: transposase [Deltaproteobacteria bacterium]|nr:transposase [Deltaproteobacteria bacterium]
MPRKARIDTSGALHHIIGRGINRQDIFSDKYDYVNFLKRLGEILKETETPCYAWALMPNHFHLLLRTGKVPISTIMRRLLTGYSVTFNKRHNRLGHLFQNRYKSILCQEDAYLLELVRYIHLNPLRAGLVSAYKELSRYPYCGHGVITGRQKHEWQDIKFVMQMFGDTEGKAKVGYSDFMQKGVELGKRPELTGGGLLRSIGGWEAVKGLRESGEYQKGDERILGDGDFVTKVLSQADEQLQMKYRMRMEGYNLESLIKRVAEIMVMNLEDITENGKDRKRSQARSIVCYWATQYLGTEQTRLAKMFNLSQPAISQAVARGKKLVKERSYSFLE